MPRKGQAPMHIASCASSPENGSVCEANAALIVEAVNHHSAHLARIKALEEGLAALLRRASAQMDQSANSNGLGNCDALALARSLL